MCIGEVILPTLFTLLFHYYRLRLPISLVLIEPDYGNFTRLALVSTPVLPNTVKMTSSNSGYTLMLACNVTWAPTAMKSFELIGL